MFSPSNLIKRVGVGGGLVPFFKCVCVYFVVGGGGPSAGAVAAKCAPVLCLLAFVLYNYAAQQDSQGRYARRVCLGLALSALGDALLVWPQRLEAGMAAFAAAHLAYIAAFRLTPLRPLIGAVYYSLTASYVWLVPAEGALRWLVPGYALLLAGMAWRAAASPRGPAAAAGAALFVLSDAVLGYSLFGGDVPYKQVIVMSTYYLGQLGIALSVLHENPDLTADRAATAHSGGKAQ